jgi:hypothetical protein
MSSGKTGGGAAAILMVSTVTPNISVTTGTPVQISSSSTQTLD